MSWTMYDVRDCEELADLLRRSFESDDTLTVCLQGIPYVVEKAEHGEDDIVWLDGASFPREEVVSRCGFLADGAHDRTFVIRHGNQRRRLESAM